MRNLDGKYQIEGDQIVNTASGEVIPEDEPLFLLRARDRESYGTLLYYESCCRMAECCAAHLAGINSRLYQFHRFRKDQPHRMKEPGSTLRTEGEGARKPMPELGTPIKSIEVVNRGLDGFVVEERCAGAGEELPALTVYPCANLPDAIRTACSFPEYDPARDILPLLLDQILVLREQIEGLYPKGVK